MTEETGTEAATASVEEMTEDFTDASMDGTDAGEAAESTDVEIEESPAPETEAPSVAASDAETAETSDPEAETPPAETSNPETEEPPAETPGPETEEPTESLPAETPAVQPEYRVQVDTVEGYHNQPVALTIRIEDAGGTGWAKLEASTEENAPEKRTDLTEALQRTALPLHRICQRYGVFLYHRSGRGRTQRDLHGGFL